MKSVKPLTKLELKKRSREIDAELDAKKREAMARVSEMAARVRALPVRLSKNETVMMAVAALGAIEAVRRTTGCYLSDKDAIIAAFNVRKDHWHERSRRTRRKAA